MKTLLPTRNRSESVAQTGQRGQERRLEPTGDTFHLYLREIGALPLLTAAEEVALAKQARRGDSAARERLITSNLRLVVAIAREYEHFGLPLLDLIAEGNVGLMKAIDRFDPSRGVRISVYASIWIKQTIRRALGNHSRTIRLPIHVHAKFAGVERVSRRLENLFGRPPSDDEVAHETGVSSRHLAQLRQATLHCTSLDAPIGLDRNVTFAAIVVDEHTGTPFEHAVRKGSLDVLEESLGHLRPREILVLRLRFGLNGDEKLTLQEVANRIGVTRERVRQIQETALKKLQRCIARRERISVTAA